MSSIAPKLDVRVASQITEQLRVLLERYTTNDSAAPQAYPFAPWKEYDPTTRKPLGASAALIGVAARLSEIVIQRLNQVPEKNFGAFLELLGAARLPPSAARVPLTFKLAAGRLESTRVPTGTRVAAVQEQDDREPVIFEVEQPLSLTPAQLRALATLDARDDTYTVHRLEMDAPNSVFRGTRPNEHALYIADERLLGYARITDVSVNVTVTDGTDASAPRELRWERWSETGWASLQPLEDSSAGLRQSGSIRFGALEALVASSIYGKTSRWLRCTLLTPIAHDADDPAEMGSLPTLAAVSITVQVERQRGAELVPELAFVNGVTADLTQPFFPFGERPKLYDTFSLASAEALARDPAADGGGSEVNVDVRLSNSRLLGGPAAVRPSADLTLVWECATVSGWREVGRSTPSAWLSLADLEPVPSLSATAEVLVRGVVERGATLSAAVVPTSGTAAETTVSSAADGRFATRVQLEPDLNVIQFSATSAQRRSRLWAVVTRGKPGAARLEVDAVTDAVSQEKLAVEIRVSGTQGLVKLVLTNGANDSVQSQSFTAVKESVTTLRFELTLQYGRNDILAELRQASASQPTVDTRLSAMTFSIARSAPMPSGAFADGTYALTQSGTIRLVLPGDASTAVVQGQENHWLRARISAGSYGADASYMLKDPANPDQGYALIPASFAPPVVATIALRYSFRAQRPAPICLALNQLCFSDLTPLLERQVPVRPFVAADQTGAALYLGFALPARAQTFPAGVLTLCVIPSSTKYSPAPTTQVGVTRVASTTPPAPPRLLWQYWNGTAWAKLSVRDQTHSLTRPGTIDLLPGRDFAVHYRLGQELYWMRVLWEQGDYSSLPELDGLLLNTTFATQSTTVVEEVLGSSSGDKNQRHRATRAPVLEGPRLEVREPELPSAEDLTILRKEEGADPSELVTSVSAQSSEVWVRWHEVSDFYGSGPHDRHYVMDHLTGEVRFGDGSSGRIPPAGAGNIRLARYRTGGGSSGNRRAGAVTQLKTTVPYVEAVENRAPAAGGAEAERLDELYERMPRTLRHRQRAVTSEDYEDLAALASPEVARTRCEPLRDLAADPLDGRARPGLVSVIVVPRSAQNMPLPTRELLSRVNTYVEQRAPAGVEVSAVGPLYVRVDVRTQVAAQSLELVNDVELALRERLDAFLHPLTGGLAGKGWDFGRAPHRSDVYALIESTPGVDHVRSLRLYETEQLEGARETGRFLVYSGAHEIEVMTEET